MILFHLITVINEQMKIFNAIEIDLQKERILKNPPFSRWIKSGESQYKLEKLVEKLWKEVKSYLSPQAIYRILRREKTDINKYSPPEPLLKAEFLVVGIVTIGEQVEKNPKSKFLLESLVIDALENVALIQAQREVVEFIKKKAEQEDLKMTRIIPPGSGRINWGTENQEFIFKNLEPEKIGVQLTSSYSMKPIKSISFVIGLGGNIEQAKELFSCEGCKRLDCSYRT